MTDPQRKTVVFLLVLDNLYPRSAWLKLAPALGSNNVQTQAAAERGCSNLTTYQIKQDYCLLYSSVAKSY